MSTFKALNVDSESEEEIDDTKEIQLEEAFKLYQNALKLHTQGPRFYEEAQAAYDELFRSEVFKYPEAISEFTHDLDDEPRHPTLQPEDNEAVPVLPANAADSSANSIPLLVYLSYKSKGQLAIDRARLHSDTSPQSRHQLSAHFSTSCGAGIQDFAEALERDDTDLDLWKKAARVAEILSSQRIGRFCMESVLAGDDDGAEQSIDISGLDEAFAAGELRQILALLQDDLSMQRNLDIHPKRRVLDMLAKTNDPYPFLPQRPHEIEYLDENRRPNAFQVDHVTLKSNTIATLGQEILQMLENVQDGSSHLSAHTIVSADQPSTYQSPGQVDKEIFVDAEEQLDIEKDGIVSDDDPTQTQQSALNAESEEAVVEGDGEPLEQNMPQASDAAAAEIQSTPVDLPTRKRSATNAGHEEPEGRTKSKRLRARESMADIPLEEEEIVHEVVQKEPWDWTVLQTADKDQLKVLDSFLSRLDVAVVGPIEAIRSDSSALREDDSDSLRVSTQRLVSSDFSKVIKGWTEEHSQAAIFGHATQEFVEKSTGLTLFLQHSKTGADVELEATAIDVGDDLFSFLKKLNSSDSTLYDSAFIWLLSILTSATSEGSHSTSSYAREVWSENMKKTVVQLLLRSEEHLLNILSQEYRKIASVEVSNPDTANGHAIQYPLSRLTEFVQSVFELHIDIYTRITNPSSQVEHHVRIKEADSLERWASLASDFMRLYANRDQQSEMIDDVVIRFLWSSTIYAGKAENVDQNHVLSCLKDLRRVLQKLDIKPFALSNNVAMPQISLSAAEQEIQRLSTLDFFLSVFDNDNTDPVAVIEKLEPILELDIAGQASQDDQTTATVGNAHRAVLEFLDSGDASLKLYLWRRLQNAYITISYIPKVVSCLLRAIEVIFKELSSKRHAQMESISRQISMLKWLRDLDDLLLRALSKIIDEPNALECLDEAHLQSSLTAISFLLRLLHVFALHEDQVRFQYTSGPQFKGAMAIKNFDKSRDRLREIQVRLWSLQYFLLREGAKQRPALFPELDNDLADYLCTVHHTLGQRLYCKYANKSFIKLVRSELSSLQLTNDYSADMAQVLYDLYQMKFVVGQGDFDHGCPSESLDKKTALSLIPVVMNYARRVNVRDLIKSDLRITIEKIQAASGKTVTPVNAVYNRKVINHFLRSPIVPEDLFKTLKGLGNLPTKPVLDDSSVKATQGWFFLLGNMTLARYRSVKRTSPTPTDDLDAAATLLKQDLEFDIEKWETWFRLAQIYEARIEDDLIWNSTKLNEARGDIAQVERCSIHAFTMALALAMRSAEDDVATRQKLAELHQELGMRLYASSREPLNMEAFSTDKNLRHLSSNYDGTISKAPFHQPISKYSLWNFAAHLLRKKISEKPNPWISHYTLGKCLWKMYHSPENSTSRRPVKYEDVLEAFVDAIEATPKKEKPSEYILEPHFKLVSIVHKLVHRKHLSAKDGRNWLQATRFAQGTILMEEEGEPEWERYILDILKRLSSADRQHWHHRIIARAAHVIYDDQPAVAGALGARHEFTQQIFTKTMTYQVWKPEFERAGRHYVYTGRYVLFFAHLLDLLNDRPNLDQLVRRVRRKQPDFIDHEKIWTSIATTYVNLLRRSAKVPDGRERTVFDGISFDEFTRNSEKLEKWALDEENTSIVLDVMRDAIELKKINNSLLKGGVIDDLIGDAYACMYEAFVAQLSPEEQHPRPTAVPQGTFVNMTSDSPSGQVDLPSTSQTLPGPSTALDILSTESRALHDGSSLSIMNVFARLLQTPPEKAKPGRTKTITRREVQRKAEAVLVKPPPIKTPTLMKRPVIDIPVSNANADSPVPRRPGRDDNAEEDPESMFSSRRGSVQSSLAGNREGSVDAGEEGDDESELSDIDENEHEGDEDEDGNEHQQKSLYPVLPSDQAGGGHESDADDDEDEEEDAHEGDENDYADDNELDDAPDSSKNQPDDKMDTDELPSREDNQVEIQDSQEATVRRDE